MTSSGGLRAYVKVFFGVIRPALVLHQKFHVFDQNNMLQNFDDKQKEKNVVFNCAKTPGE